MAGILLIRRKTQDSQSIIPIFVKHSSLDLSCLLLRSRPLRFLIPTPVVYSSIREYFIIQGRNHLLLMECKQKGLCVAFTILIVLQLWDTEPCSFFQITFVAFVQSPHTQTRVLKTCSYPDRGLQTNYNSLRHFLVIDRRADFILQQCTF